MAEMRARSCRRILIGRRSASAGGFLKADGDLTTNLRDQAWQPCRDESCWMPPLGEFGRLSAAKTSDTSPSGMIAWISGAIPSASLQLDIMSPIMSIPDEPRATRKTFGFLASVLLSSSICGRARGNPFRKSALGFRMQMIFPCEVTVGMDDKARRATAERGPDGAVAAGAANSLLTILAYRR